MDRHLKPCFTLSLILLSAISICGCRSQNIRNRADENKLPHVILWAWERPEDLQFLDPKRYGVAFLAQTLTLKDDEVVVHPRRQPLKVPPNTCLIAVTRIESRKNTGQSIALSENQRSELVNLILKTLDRGDVASIQVDFDAVVSERDFYRALLVDLRRRLPDHVPLSMTALASFCIGDRWLRDLPVDEAIPMVFRMGADSKSIKKMLTDGQDFRPDLCRRSYGIAIDEPFDAQLNSQRRVYAFNARPWTIDDLAFVEKRIH